MFQHQIFLISYLGTRSVSLALSKKLGQRPKYCLKIERERRPPGHQGVQASYRRWGLQLHAPRFPLVIGPNRLESFWRQNRNLPAKSKQNLRELNERQHACHAVAHYSGGDKAMEEVFHQSIHSKNKCSPSSLSVEDYASLGYLLEPLLGIWDYYIKIQWWWLCFHVETKRLKRNFIFSCSSSRIQKQRKWHSVKNIRSKNKCLQAADQFLPKLC